MRLNLSLVLGALLGTSHAAVVVARQEVSQPPQQTGSTDAPGSGSSPTSPSAPPPSSSSSSTTEEQDTTVVVTVSVTKDVDTVSSKTTATVTDTTTVVVTKTNIVTTSITDSTEDVSTKYVVETSTKIVDKRAVIVPDLPARTVPAPADAYPTAPAVRAVTNARDAALGTVGLDKRAEVTQTTTVTVGNGGGTTVVNTITNRVVKTTTTETTITNTFTEKIVINAKSTTTVTTTLVVTSTKVAEGTSTQTPTGGSSPDTGNDGNTQKSSSTGLSTGAKAGIGVGAAIGAIAVIGAIIFFCLRSRRGRSKPDHDDFMGASEVPVGGPGSSHTPMSNHTADAAAFLAPGRTPIKPHPSVEGYRGTAMGDGRAGYAKPDPYGSAYTSPSNTMTHASRVSPMTADVLPEHSTPVDARNAALFDTSPRPHTAELGSDSGAGAKWHNADASEIDSNPVASHQSGPVPANVYEMPAQPYR